MRLPPPRPPRESRADARNIESAVSSPTESGSRGVTVAWLPVAVVAGLVVATAVAFVQTERLKLVPSPILDTVVSKSFGPDCGCRTDHANIAFRLRRQNLMSVEVVTIAGRPVRRLAAHEFGPGFWNFVWYGRGGANQAVPQGAYKVKLRLWTERRTIVLPNVIQLDRTRPTVAFTVDPRTIVEGQRMRIRYHLSEPAHPLVYIDGKLAVRGRWPYLRSSVDWFGKIGQVAVLPGAHRLRVRAQDIAGNLSAMSAPLVIVVTPVLPSARQASSAATTAAPHRR
jgi:hypothetical protein